MNSDPTGGPTRTGDDQLTGTEGSAERNSRRRTDDAIDLTGVAPGDAASHAEVVLHAERLLLTRERFTTERVRFRKQIVTTTRTIEVPVRIEQLLISHEPLPADSLVVDLAVPVDSRAGVDVGRENDVVIVLHEEVPDITLRVVPVERITVGVRTIVGGRTITAPLGRETVVVEHEDGGWEHLDPQRADRAVQPTRPERL